MSTEATTMTLHRALSELKVVDARIQRAITELVPVGLHQKDGLVNGTTKLDEFTKAATAGLQSAQDLIIRKGKLKSAIVEANGKTIVKVGGKEMTIADAINQKQSIAFKKQLLESIKAKLQSTTGKLNQGNEQVNKNLDAILNAALGKETAKAGGDAVDNIAKPYLEMNRVHMADPLEAQKLVETLAREIEDFESDVDAALSEINAVTMVTIS